MNKKVNIAIAIVVSLVFGFILSKTNELTTSDSQNLSQTINDSSESSKNSTLSQAAVSNESREPSSAPTMNGNPIDDKLIDIIQGFIKSNLMGLYAAEMSWREEMGRFTTDIKFVGFNVDSHVVAAKFGFLNQFDPESVMEGEHPNLMNTDELVARDVTSDGKEYDYAASAEDVDLNSIKNYCQEGCTATENTFEIIAAANLDDDNTYDVWVINDRKELRHVVDDLKE